MKYSKRVSKFCKKKKISFVSTSPWPVALSFSTSDILKMLSASSFPSFSADVAFLRELVLAVF